MKKYMKPAMKVANIDSENLLAAISDPSVSGDVKDITNQGSKDPDKRGGDAKLSGYTSDDLWLDDAAGAE